MDLDQIPEVWVLWHFACLGWPVNDEDDVDFVNYDDHYIFISKKGLLRVTIFFFQTNDNYKMLITPTEVRRISK